MGYFVYDLADALGAVGETWQDRIKQHNDAKKKQMRERIRFFRPTIIDGFWCKSTHWELRDKPLTDEELKQFDQ